MKKYSLSALVAAGLLAGGLSVTSANAADLGGNCCADLEERIAELEATTARKGNRKVSLTISGWVAQQVVYWDNGEESNTYVEDIGQTLASHVKFTGQATISPGWTAGYVLHLEAPTGDSLGVNQDTDESTGVYVLQSYWFIKSDHLGKVGIGRQSAASDNAAILVDGSGSLVPANWVLFDVVNYGPSATSNPNSINFLGAQACREGGAAGDCYGFTSDVVRYDSPTFGGFSFSASWGEDDMWDVAARYAGEFSGFKLAATIAYGEDTDASNTNINGSDKSEYLQIGAYVQHVPTGLFLYGAYGDYTIDDDNDFNADNGDQETYYIKAGLRQRWTPLGHTVLYGEYLNNNYQLDFNGAESELEWYGLGVVQEIDSAAMSIWLSYRHYQADADAGFAAASGRNVATDPDDFDLIKFGALINF